MFFWEWWWIFPLVMMGLCIFMMFKMMRGGMGNMGCMGHSGTNRQDKNNENLMPPCCSMMMKFMKKGQEKSVDDNPVK
ncbi:MAG: hypothetical protein ABFD63_12400 [Smithella sp.]